MDFQPSNHKIVSPQEHRISTTISNGSTVVLQKNGWERERKSERERQTDTEIERETETETERAFFKALCETETQRESILQGTV